MPLGWGQAENESASITDCICLLSEPLSWNTRNASIRLLAWQRWKNWLIFNLQEIFKEFRITGRSKLDLTLTGFLATSGPTSSKWQPSWCVISTISWTSPISSTEKAWFNTVLALLIPQHSCTWSYASLDPHRTAETIIRQLFSSLDPIFTRAWFLQVKNQHKTCISKWSLNFWKSNKNALGGHRAI